MISETGGTATIFVTTDGKMKHLVHVRVPHETLCGIMLKDEEKVAPPRDGWGRLAMCEPCLDQELARMEDVARKQEARLQSRAQTDAATEKKPDQSS